MAYEVIWHYCLKNTSCYMLFIHFFKDSFLEKLFLPLSPGLYSPG